MANQPRQAPARFPTTHWSEVARAGDMDPQVRRAALGRLLTEYSPALKAHLIGYKRMNRDRADDLIQGFICDQVIADDLMKRADCERGRLRTFVLVALDRYEARVARADHAGKRKPEGRMVSIADHEPPAEAGADVFDQAWAREVVERAIGEMREQCKSGRREQVWRIFESCALGPLLEETEPPSHREAMEKHGLRSPQEVANTLVTGKRMFARVLRVIVGEYARDRDEVEEELRDLFKILSQNHGRNGQRTETS